MVKQESYKPLIEWINQEEHDFFWVEKFREAFGCLTSEHTPELSIIKHFMNMLRTNGVIVCTEVRGSRRQYHRVRLVKMEDLCRQAKQ